jgi:hydrophobe/amphiphile efflux-1 (HAE1) family protein
MKFTDIFIKKPVLAIVISLLILLVGLRAYFELPLRQFPEIQKSVITISTAYPGADAKLMQGFITTPVIKSISSVNGLDYVSASSRQGVSIVTAHLLLTANLQSAYTDIMGRMTEVQKTLPRESEKPVVVKGTGDEVGLMYIGFKSKQMAPAQITHYIRTEIQPKLESLAGVAEAEILGGSEYAIRIWLDPKLMAAHQITYETVVAALQRNNFLTTAGSTKGYLLATGISANTDLSDAQGFKKLIIKHQNNDLIRLQDIAKIELGVTDYDTTVYLDGEKAIFIKIAPTPTANPLVTINHVKEVLPTLSAQFPPSLKVQVSYDATVYIRDSITEVIRTLAEATLIVIAIIFLFLGNFRSVLIPVVTIPLSLIGVFTLLLALNYSFNLLTLLAMVLAIGLVVDDAIVVVENIFRHIQAGKSPQEAALLGAREIALPVISMTITLAAVYAPIAFQGGLTGILFKEFSITLACTVIISGVIALVLSPMMCAKLLSAELLEKTLVKRVDTFFLRLRRSYQDRLSSTLRYQPIGIFVAIVIMGTCFVFYSFSQKELAPKEDQSALFISANAPEDANIDFVEHFSQRYLDIFQTYPELKSTFLLNMPNRAFAGMLLSSWNKRQRSQESIQKQLQADISQISGMQSFVFNMPDLPIASGFSPIEFVITSTRGYPLLQTTLDNLLKLANESGLFMFAVGDMQYNRPNDKLLIDRNRAALLGIDMANVGSALATALGGNYISRFSMESNSYQIIPQLQQKYRLSTDQLKNIYLRTQNGKMISLDTIATVTSEIQPNQLNQFNQLHAATLMGAIMPGHSMSEVIDFLATKAKTELPDGVSFDFTGESRQFIQEGNKLAYTIFFALIIIFLVLAAQFESFRAPFIILFSVPLSMFGALLPLFLGVATVNIYSQIGLVTLIGLISKHGILLVDFANKIRGERALSAVDAMVEAAGIRLRPILMTTAAMVLGVLPLVLASGPGAKSRFSIGIVISCGMLVGTLFTLFIVPTVYCRLIGPVKTA